MKTLFLDTSSFLVNVTILENDVILYSHVSENDNKLSDRIFDIVEDVYKKANVKPLEIGRIFVTNGPGSFTGIRIGLTIAKTMAWSMKIPVYTISSLELMVSGANEKATALIKDRNDFVYAGVYDNNLDNIEKDSYLRIEDIDLSQSVFSYDEFSFTTSRPKIDLIKVIKKHENDDVKNPHLIAPNYLKNTDAEKSVSND